MDQGATDSMNTIVSYGSLAPSVIGGLGVVVQTLLKMAVESNSLASLKKLPDVIEFCDSGIWGDNPIGEPDEPHVFRVSDFDGDFRLNYTSAPTRSIPANKLEKFRLQRGDILVVKSSGSAKQVVSGRVAVFAGDDSQTFVASNFLLRLRPRADINPGYLAFILGSPPIRTFIADSVKTMTYPNLSFRIYSQIDIPVIPIEDQQLIASFFTAMLNCEPLPLLPRYLKEQHRIVARIVELAAQIAEAKALRKQALEEAEVVYTTRLSQCMEPDSEDWRRETVADLILGMDAGWSPQCEDASAREGEWGVLKTTSVQWCQFRPYENKALPKALQPVAELAVQEGDVLVTRAGPRKRVGVVAAVRKSQPRLTISDKLIRLRPDPKKIEPRFLELSLASPFSQEHLVHRKTGLADAQVNISQAILRATPVAYPSLGDQRRIVAELDALQAEVNNLKRLQAETAAGLDALLPSILDKAFKGEL
jgi:restriction endonuclease S subunit